MKWERWQHLGLCYLCNRLFQGPESSRLGSRRGRKEGDGRGFLKGFGESAQRVIVITLYSTWIEWGIGRLILWIVTKENRYEA